MLTYNKLAVSKICIPTLLKSSYRHWELIVVDNGSNDDTVKWLKELKELYSQQNIPLEIITNSTNVGCSTARNQGAAIAKGDYFIFLDNDVAIRTVKWMEKLLECFNKNPKIGITGPKLVYPIPPYNIQCAGVSISPSGRPLFRGRGLPINTPQFNTNTFVHAVISACLMVKAELFRKVSGFDEMFNPVEYEDFDFCYKIKMLGYNIFYVANTELYHIESTTTARTPSLHNTALIIRHGILFKKRWQHVFKNENGPPDHETIWQKINPIKLDEIKELPLIK